MEPSKENLLAASLSWFPWLRKLINYPQFALIVEKKLLLLEELLSLIKSNWLEEKKATSQCVENASVKLRQLKLLREKL